MKLLYFLTVPKEGHHVYNVLILDLHGHQQKTLCPCRTDEVMVAT